MTISSENKINPLLNITNYENSILRNIYYEIIIVVLILVILALIYFCYDYRRKHNELEKYFFKKYPDIINRHVSINSKTTNTV